METVTHSVSMTHILAAVNSAVRRACGWLAITAITAGAAHGLEPFIDVTGAVGLQAERFAKVAWGDFNNDGWVDLYVGQLWRNEKGQRFVKVDGPFDGAGVWGDYNNDGLLDLYLYESHTLLRNEGGTGQFLAVADGLPERPIQVCRGALWGDLDGDGFLDLYIAGYEDWPDGEWPDVIFRNEKGKSFSQIWRSPRVERARGVTAADFDEDGNLDIYVSNYRLQPNRLLRSDGKGNFEEIGAEYGVDGDEDMGAWGHTIGSAFGDFDNDGHIDLFVGNFSHPPRYQDRPKFLRNLGPCGSFKFRDLSGEAGLAWQESFASPALADFDNDGFLDLCLTSRYEGDHNVLVRNVSASLDDAPQARGADDTSPVGAWRFQDVTSEVALPKPGTYQAAWADYDNDGYLDLMLGGKLLRNPGGDNNWLKVRLDGGAATQRGAIGASVRVHAKQWTLTRQVGGGMGEGNQNDSTLHFGLAKLSGPVKIDVHWPDGTLQSLEAQVNQLLEVKRATEGNPGETTAQLVPLTTASVIGGSGSANGNWDSLDEGNDAGNGTHITDGSLCESSRGFWVVTSSDGGEEYLVIDLGTSYAINQIDLYNTHNRQFNNFSTNSFRIEASNSVVDLGGPDDFDLSGTITTILSGNLSLTHPEDPIATADSFSGIDIISHPQVSVRYLKFVSVSGHNLVEEGPPELIYHEDRRGLNEINVFGTEMAPIPDTPDTSKDMPEG